MIWGMWEGLVGRVRTILAGEDIARRQAEREEEALEAARHLDADEVARRADARAADRDADIAREGVPEA